MSNTILRLRQVIESNGISRSSFYNLIADGLFSKPVVISARSVGWPADEVATINAARIAGLTDEAIRQLVKQLEAERKHRLVRQLQRNAALVDC